MNVQAPVVQITSAGGVSPAQLALGKRVSLALPLRNDGNVPAPKSTTVQFIVSTDGTMAARFHQSQVSAMSGLPPVHDRGPRLAM